MGKGAQRKPRLLLFAAPKSKQGNAETAGTSTSPAVTRAIVQPAAKKKTQKQSGAFHFIGRFKEATKGVDNSDPSKQGKRFRVTMLEEGLGNFGDAYFYTREAIQSAPQVFEGKKLFVDHPSKIEEESLPERSVEDIAGYFENCAAEEQEDGTFALMGDLVTLDGADYDKYRVLMIEALTYQNTHPTQDLIGLSINASGDFTSVPIEQFMQSTDIPEACKAKLQEAMQQGVTVVRPVSKMESAVSCDLVTTAGAGGKIKQLLERGKSMALPKKEAEHKEGDGPEMDDTQMGDQGTSKDGDDADGASTDDQGDHADAEQDEELIMNMLKKYLGAPDFSDEDKQMAKEAYQHAKEMGLEGKEAEQCAGQSMKMSKHLQKKQAAEAAAMPKESEEGEEHKEAGDPDATGGKGFSKGEKSISPSDAKNKMKPQDQKESARGNDMVKLAAEVARLTRELNDMKLAAFKEKALSESKLPREATKKFRESVKGVRSVTEFKEKLDLFKEAYNLRGEANEVGFILNAEKQGDIGEGSFDFSDCVKE